MTFFVRVFEHVLQLSLADFLIQTENFSQGWLSWVSNLSLLSVSLSFRVKQCLHSACYLPCSVSGGVTRKEDLAWQTQCQPRLRKQKPSEVWADWQSVDKVTIAKLPGWLEATALILSLSPPLPTSDISASWFHHIWPSNWNKTAVGIVSTCRSYLS